VFGRIEKFTTVENQYQYISHIVCCGTDQERIQDRGFSIRHWYRDVWYVACLFAKLVLFFEFHFVVDRDSIVASMDQIEIDPLVVEQALL